MRLGAKNHKIPPIAGRKLPSLWQWRNGEGAFSAIFNAFVNILRRVGKIVPANVKCFNFFTENTFPQRKRGNPLSLLTPHLASPLAGERDCGRHAPATKSFLAAKPIAQTPSARSLTGWGCYPSLSMDCVSFP